MKYIREGRVHVDDYDDDRVTALQVAAATGKSIFEFREANVQPFSILCLAGVFIREFPITIESSKIIISWN